MRIVIFCLLPVLCLLGCYTHTGASTARSADGVPEEHQIGSVLEEISTRLQRLAEQQSASRPGARASADSAAYELRYMVRKWAADSRVPRSYRANLGRIRSLLQTAEQEADAEQAYAIWRAVLDDVFVKARHCRATGSGIGGPVQVEVRTLRENEEARGWRIFYLPRFLAFAEQVAPSSFARFSSPTAEPLPPGRYLFWAGRPNAEVVTERLLLDVGGGREQLTLDIAVP